MPNNVFVYGTLLFPKVTKRLGIVSCDDNGKSTDKLNRQSAVLSGYERFTVRYREIGNFPAIIDSDSEVTGEILLNVTDGSLKTLDRFEGIQEGYYVRKTENVQLDHGTDSKTLTAEVYVCGDLIREKLDGPWDPDKFRENELDWYLEHLFG